MGEEDGEEEWTYENTPDNEKGEFIYVLKPVGRATKRAKR